jgi:putative lipoprotein
MAPRAWCSIALLLLLAPLSALAAPRGGDWLGRDKALHFGISAGLAGAGYLGGTLLFEEPRARWLTGAGLSLALGLGKELHDAGRVGNRFSIEDLTWDVLGTAYGLAMSWLMERLLPRWTPARGGVSLTLAYSPRFEGPVPGAPGRGGSVPVLLLLWRGGGRARA